MRLRVQRRAIAEALIAGSLLYFVGSALAQGNQTPAAKPDDAASRLQDLKFQKLCSEAGERFWTEWNRQPAPKEPDVFDAYTNHYNRQMNKCLVEVSVTTLNTKENSMSVYLSVWDAYGKTLIGEKFTETDVTAPANEGHGILWLLKDNHRIPTTPQNLRWFEDLMLK